MRTKKNRSNPRVVGLRRGVPFVCVCVFMRGTKSRPPPLPIAVVVVAVENLAQPKKLAVAVRCRTGSAASASAITRVLLPLNNPQTTAAPHQRRSEYASVAHCECVRVCV